MPVSAPLRPLRIEQYVTYLRVFGLVVGTPTLLLAGFSGPDQARLAWGIQAVLLVGTVALWVWRRHMRPSDETAVLMAGFALNAVVIAGYVLAFSHVQPDVSWAMVFTLVADAALRFGARGAVLGWLLAGVLFAVQAQAHEAATGVATPLVAYLYVLGALAGAAGILALFTVTLGRQARLAQQQALALADANRVRERLLAMSSHEFRGSLAAIMMASETVRAHLDRLGPDRVQALLGEVDRHGRNLSRLVDDLVAVAQAESDTIQVRRRWDELPSSVQVALAAAERHRRGHALSVSVEEVSCLLDHERFQQVVRNLVENAYKYAPPGSRVVVLASHHTAHPDHAGHGPGRSRVELRVADDGPGIPAADRDRVFEPYIRRRGASAHHDHNGESSGLGLYVVQQIVTAMQGSIQMHTSPAGTEFVVSLPAEVAGASSPETADPSGLWRTTHNGHEESDQTESRDAVQH
jgi:signal transduction histidine kinase